MGYEMNMLLREIRIRARFEQIIVAGGDEDVSTSDLLDWVDPILVGIPHGKWASCELEFQSDSVVFARFRTGMSEIEINTFADWTDEEVKMVASQIPGATSLAMVMLNDYTSQVMTLMDGVASWLSVFETSQNEMKPIVRLFDKLAALAGVAIPLE